MADVVSINPKDVDPVVSINPADVDPPSPSIMDPHPVQSGVRRIGRVVGALDPTNPANLPRVAPPAAGTATAIGAPLAGAAIGGAIGGPPGAVVGGLTGAAVGGFGAPYAEYATSKALGNHPAVPAFSDAVKGAVINTVFEGNAQVSKFVGASERAAAAELAGQTTRTATEMERLPPELRTPENIRAAATNRDFLGRMGMSPQEIDAAIADPAGTAERLQQSVNEGLSVADTFNKTVEGERARFKTRYDAAYGAQANAPVDTKPMADQMRQIAQGQGQHELTPTFRNFLLRKADELEGLTPKTAPVPGEVLQGATKAQAAQYRGIDLDPGTQAQLEAQKRGITDNRELRRIGQEARAAAQKGPTTTVQDLRSLRTEIRENVPAGATNLDRKIAGQLDQSITDNYEKSILDHGGTNEQIGQLRGIDQDYGEFQRTIGTLKPGSKEFGEQTADAFFQTAKNNPTLALNYVRMAEESGTMPEFREQFLKNLTGEMQATDQPLSQMEVLQKLQTTWRTTEDGKQVLRSVFGKNSPMADPVEFSKIYSNVASASGKAKAAEAAQSVISGYIRSPRMIVSLASFYATYSLIVGHAGSPWGDLRKNPQAALTGIVGAALTLAGVNKIMSTVSPQVQRTYASWLVNHDPESFANLIRMTGATTTGLTSQPSEETRP
jgi:hypothetical protein